MKSLHPQGAIVTFAAIVAICVLTLTPVQPSPNATESPWWCLWCGEFSVIDTLANVLLFAPLGLGLRLLGVRPSLAAGVAFAGTIAIETLQLQVVVGRDANLRDVLTNTLGAGFGFALASHLRSFWQPSRQLAAFLSGVVAVGWIASRTATGLLLAPSPPEGEWYGQIAPQDVYPANVLGDVSEPTVNQRTVVVDRLKWTEDITMIWRGGSLEVSASLRLDVLPSRLASAVSVLNATQQEAFVIGVEGTDLVFRARTRAADVGLRSPAVRLSNAFSIGEAHRVEGALRNRKLLVTVDGLQRRQMLVPLSSGLGWALLSPFDLRLGAGSAWISAFVVGCVTFALGWVAARALRIPAALLLGVVTVAVGLLLPPFLTVAATTPAPEWVGGLLGVSAGTITSAWALRPGGPSRGTGESDG